MIPGVLDSTTNFVEHLASWRSGSAMSRISSGASGWSPAPIAASRSLPAQQNPVAPSVVWAKLEALVEGARIASTRLWQ